MERAIVDAFTAERGAGLAEMDADLVRASRFQPALDETVAGPRLQHADMRDGMLAPRTGAAATVASIADQRRLDPTCDRDTSHQGDIRPVRVVGPELLAELRLRLGSAGEGDEATRVAIKPMDRPDAESCARCWAFTSCGNRSTSVGGR